MSINILRTEDGWWAVRGERAVHIGSKALTTAELIADRDAIQDAVTSTEAGTPSPAPPFVGQGLCAGLRDAFDLTWKLARVLTEGADERILDTYQRERKPHARRLIRLAVATGWAMTGGQDRAAALRRTLVVAAACRIPGVTAAAGQDLGRALPPGPLVRRPAFPRGAWRAATAPNPG
ncbi:hypothetical protein GCM10014713_45150 [Streptomyces purpureus]|uniref:FAD-binding domain-containing protein n=1 Tax=Streptomyces purpureus TaxID=1951 RepID=A0A918HAS9_9ACTN|nr:hypothetical protein GCM10014713_45150 [Streptomyces purpureus]